MHPGILPLKDAIVSFATFKDKNVEEAVLDVINRLGDDLKDCGFETSGKYDKLTEALTDAMEQSEDEPDEDEEPDVPVV